MAHLAANIDTALRRLQALGEAGADGARALSPARHDVLGSLRAAPSPLSIPEIAQAVSLHPNTVRHHLDVLTEAGLVTSSKEASTRRGRPRTLYRASSTVTESFDEVNALLGDVARAGGGDAIAIETARLWFEAVPPVEPAKDLDDAVLGATQSLQAAGFNARADAIGDSIVVTDCPYASLIEEHPMICTVHAELTARVLARTGQPVALKGFDVWVRPGVCRARLRRPDTTPAFTAAPVSAPAEENT